MNNVIADFIVKFLDRFGIALTGVVIGIVVCLIVDRTLGLSILTFAVGLIFDGRWSSTTYINPPTPQPPALPEPVDTVTYPPKIPPV